MSHYLLRLVMNTVRRHQLLFRAAAIGAVFTPLFLASCSSSGDLTTNPSVTNTDDVAALLIESNRPIQQWQQEDNDALPMNPPVDPNGGHGGSDSVRPPDNGKRMRPLPIPCLGLTPEQMELIRQFQAQLDSANHAVMSSIQDQLDALRQQERAAWEAFRQATASQREELAALYRQFRSQVDSIRKLVRSGALSKDDARAMLRQLAQDFMNARRSIIDSTADARAQLRAALDRIAQARKALMDSIQPQLDSNYQQFLNNVASILTPEQLLIWQEWLAGKDPCKGRGRGPGK